MALGALPALAVAGDAPAAAASAATPAALQKQLRQRDREVGALRRQVDRQESKGRQAGERLRQQEREIAELQRQLDAARAAAAPRQRENPPQK
ncbi:hypothetical protein ASG87_17050 [Frateuria sp. Soil773]|nr:hypothetical protein ASG87_17050 [Frateuria sp. Soil773]